MNNYSQVLLDNGNKYVIIDMLEYDDKRYFLLARMFNEDKDIDTNFDICEFNVNSNCFEYIDDKNIYDNVKKCFLQRLNSYKFMEFEEDKFIKLKVIDIDDYNYKLEKDNGEIIIKNIDFYGDKKVEVNDYIYMIESTVLEDNIFQYGPIINNKNEIIKIVDGKEEYYLQRYYG